jgi:hypothetical protein
MCRRFSLAATPEELAYQFHLNRQEYYDISQPIIFTRKKRLPVIIHTELGLCSKYDTVTQIGRRWLKILNPE